MTFPLSGSRELVGTCAFLCWSSKSRSASSCSSRAPTCRASDRRATGRLRELAIRAALGASRGQLIRQLLGESLVVGLCGGIVGLLLSSWLVVLLVRFLPAGLPRADAIRLDTTVMLVTLLVSIGTGLLFGILPALQASRTRGDVDEGAIAGAARARTRRTCLSEIALSSSCRRCRSAR